MDCSSLLTMSQNVIRKGVSKRLQIGIRDFERDFNERKHHHNCSCTLYDNPPPLYNFSQIFFQAIEPYIRYDIVEGSTLNQVLRHHMNILEFMLPEHGRFMQFILEKYERFIQFIGWLQLVQPEVVCQVLRTASCYFQIKMFVDDFSVENFKLTLKWDQQYTGVLLFNNRDSHLHFMLTHHLLASNSSLLLLDKIREIVAVYGKKYLMYVPTSDMYARRTLVLSMLQNTETRDFDQPSHALLEYLIHECPAALKINAYTLDGNNSFVALCKRWKNPNEERHVWMVSNVMKYADISDILAIVHPLNITLAEYAKITRNTLVLNYIREKFHVE